MFGELFEFFGSFVSTQKGKNITFFVLLGPFISLMIYLTIWYGKFLDWLYVGALKAAGCGEWLGAALCGVTVSIVVPWAILVYFLVGHMSRIDPFNHRDY
jgi:hypothetical protein